MEFVKEFALFLFKEGVIKFGDFTLASGKKSSYYIDLRLIPSNPHIFRKMIKALQKEIIENTGLDAIDAIVSVPTGGLVIASALAFETVKPLIYVRNKPKDYGTSKSIEGKTWIGMKVLMVDDVATTGSSVINAIKQLKSQNIKVRDSYAIVNRLEGADANLKEEGVRLHNITDILQITKILHDEKLIDKKTLDSIKEQIHD